MREFKTVEQELFDRIWTKHEETQRRYAARVISTFWGPQKAYRAFQGNFPKKLVKHLWCLGVQMEGKGQLAELPGGPVL